MTTKINELDIIHLENRFYLAEIVSETGAYLVEYKFGIFEETDSDGNFSFNYQTECSYNRLMVKPFINDATLYHLHGHEHKLEGKAHIVGKVTARMCGNILFNIRSFIVTASLSDKLNKLSKNLNKITNSRTNTEEKLKKTPTNKSTKTKKK